MNASTAAAPVYLDNETYQRLKAALATLVAQPFEHEGTDPETEVVFALGEVGGVWPEFVRDDMNSN